MLFIWGLDRKFHVAVEVEGQFGHIGFNGAKPVLLSGEIIIGKHGYVKQIGFQSGHYEPHPIHVRRFFRYLKSLGMKNDAFYWSDHLMGMSQRSFAAFLRADTQ